MADKTVNVITTQLVAGRGPDEWVRRTVEKPVPVPKLAAGLTAFLGDVVDAFQVTGKLLGAFQLEEVQFAAEVGPDGDFRLVGTGNPEVAGGVRFTLKRKHDVHTADLARLLVGTEVGNDDKASVFRAGLYTQKGDPPVEEHAALYTTPTDPPVKVQVTGTVPVAEQNLPLPVVGI